MMRRLKKKKEEEEEKGERNEHKKAELQWGENEGRSRKLKCVWHPWEETRRGMLK